MRSKVALPALRSTLTSRLTVSGNATRHVSRSPMTPNAPPSVAIRAHRQRFRVGVDAPGRSRRHPRPRRAMTRRARWSPSSVPHRKSSSTVAVVVSKRPSSGGNVVGARSGTAGAGTRNPSMPPLSTPPTMTPNVAATSKPPRNANRVRARRIADADADQDQRPQAADPSDLRLGHVPGANRQGHGADQQEEDAPANQTAVDTHAATLPDRVRRRPWPKSCASLGLRSSEGGPEAPRRLHATERVADQHASP